MTTDPTARRPTRLRVLVVEDNRDAAESLAQLLRLWGHEVRTAGDGPAALTAAEAFAPDAAILDIGLPGLDGCQVAGRLRTATAAPFLIAVTGLGRGEELRRRVTEAGFDLFLLKPTDTDRLRRVLASLPVADG